MLEEFIDFGAHAADSVEALFLQPPLLQALYALFHEREAHLVDAVLLLGRGASFARRQVNWFFAVHGVKPWFAILLGEGLESVNDIWLLFKGQVEAESFLKVRDAADAAGKR